MSVYERVQVYEREYKHRHIFFFPHLFLGLLDSPFLLLKRRLQLLVFFVFLLQFLHQFLVLPSLCFHVFDCGAETLDDSGVAAIVVFEFFDLIE